eukprot:14725260-Heterocapsa_arctica.AAC.1
MDVNVEAAGRPEAAGPEPPTSRGRCLERRSSPEAAATARMPASSAEEAQRARPRTACPALVREELASSSTGLPTYRSCGEDPDVASPPT